MKEWPLAVTLAVTLSAVPAAAAQALPDQSSRPRPAPSDASAAPLRATTIRVRGTISTYDAKGGVLALSTTTGLLRFPVPPGTRVRHAGHTVDRAELNALTGFRAAVRYSESGGHTTVESVNVFDTSERNPR